MQVKTNKMRLGLAGGLAVFLALLMFKNVDKFFVDESLLSGYLSGAIALLILCPLLVAFKVELPRFLGLILGVVMLISSIVISVYLVELLAFNEIFAMDPTVIWLNIAWASGVYLLLYALTNRFKWAIILGQAFFLVIGIANQVVLTFRGNPLFPWDFFSLRTAANVSGQYQFELNYPVIMAVLMVLCCCLLSLQLDYKMAKWRHKIVSSLACGAVALLFIGVFYITNLTDALDIHPTVWNQPQGYKENGVILSIADNAKYLVIQEPEEYSVAKVKKIMGVENTLLEQEKSIFPELGIATRAEAGENEAGVLDGDSEKPNVIVVMNEAFSDLRVIGDFATNQDEMPFLRSLEQDTIRGDLLVSVYGGNTCNSEFEFLTGSTMAFLPAGSVAYQQYIQGKVPSLASSLDAQGYRSIAVHPYDRSGWDRERIYGLLGFEQFLSIEDFDLDQVTLARDTYVDDRSDYQKLIALYEAKAEGEKLFLFNVTIQNHGGYNLDDQDSTDRVIVIGDEYPVVDQYLSLIKRSDQAFQELVAYFDAQEEPTIIVIFGDHQPKLPEEFLEEVYGKPDSELTLAEVQKKYTVPFLIWANYDIAEATNLQISANYLSTLVLETAGLDLSPFNRYLQALSKELPVINAEGYLDKTGRYWAHDENSPYSALLNDYKIVQYNQLFDRSNRVEALFAPPTS